MNPNLMGPAGPRPHRDQTDRNVAPVGQLRRQRWMTPTSLTRLAPGSGSDRHALALGLMASDGLVDSQPVAARMARQRSAR